MGGTACRVSVGLRQRRRRAAAAVLAATGWLSGSAWSQESATSMMGAAPDTMLLVQRLALSLSPPLPTSAPGGGMDLGVTWRQPLPGPYRVDITAWRRTAAQNDALALVQQREGTVYGARAELKFSSQRHLLVDLKGALGVQLDSGARIGLRRANGGPTLYYRNQF